MKLVDQNTALQLLQKKAESPLHSEHQTTPFPLWTSRSSTLTLTRALTLPYPKSNPYWRIAVGEQMKEMLTTILNQLDNNEFEEVREAVKYIALCDTAVEIAEERTLTLTLPL